MDLSKLLGGKQFLLSCTLSMNGCGIDIHALTDTGANGFLFLNRPLAKQLSKSLGIKIQKLPYTVQIRGYDGVTSSLVN